MSKERQSREGVREEKECEKRKRDSREELRVEKERV